MSHVLGGSAGDGGASAPVRATDRASRSSRASSEVDIHATGTGACGKCGRVWNSERQAHCPLCCCHFTSDSAFDRHLGETTCADPKRFRDRNGRLMFKRVELAGGPAWARARHRDHPFAGVES